MRLEDLKALAGKRTHGTWWPSFGRSDRGDGYSFGMGPTVRDGNDCEQAEADSEFIAAAANNIDALIKIAEAAREMDEYYPYDINPGLDAINDRIRKALEALESRAE